MILINFKTYQEGTGEEAIGLVKIIESVTTQTQVKIIPVVQATDLKEISLMTKLEVWAQHIDPAPYGAHTGAILAEAVLEDGASGVFLNHSEHKFRKLEDLQRAVQRAKEVGLKTLIFASDLEELKKVLPLAPTYVAYEPPELIGSQETSVARAQPEIIGQAVEFSKKAGLPLVVGAGVSSEEDVRISLQLGAVGVAVASSVVKAKDPKKKLLELVRGFS